MIKAVILSAIVHFLLFKFVFIGFSVVMQDQGLQLLYLGSEDIIDELEGSPQKPLVPVSMKVENSDPRWFNYINLNKPKW